MFSTFSVELSDNYVWGNGPANTNLKLTLRSADGDYQGHFFDDTDSNGYWEGRFWGTVDAGDKVTATDGSSSRTFIVQPISYTINRITDVVSGKSVPNSHVDIEVYGCQGDGGCDRNVDVSRSTNGLGNFSLDTTNQYNIRGNDYVSARWESPQGDEVFRYLDAPSMTAWVGHNEAWGETRPRQDVTVWLFNSQGTQKAKFKDRASPWYGDFEGTFAANGHPVNIRVGDFVGSNIASDALFQVIANNPVFDTGNDTVSGKCFKNKVVYVYAERTDGSYGYGYANGFTNSNGNFTIDLNDSSGFDLLSGDAVEIRCRNAQGDDQQTNFEVP